MIRLPKRIGPQLLLLLAGSVTLFQASVLITQAVHPEDHSRLPFQAQQLVFVVDALALLPPRDGATYVARINAAQPDKMFRLLPVAAPGSIPPADERLASQLMPHLPAGTRLAGTAGGVLQIQTPGGLVVEVDPTQFKPKAPNLMIIGAIATVAILSALVFLTYVYINLRRPLGLFAAAVDRFGLDRSFEPVSEKGPAEIATVARVFNRMQERITTMMSDRTRTLAALGHDLRTPITRLRLRAEKVGDPLPRNALIRDLDYMQRMAHAALTYLRDDAPSAKASIDVASLLQTICDEADEMGQPVVYDGPEHLIAMARIDDLRRAVTNLVANAVFQEADVTVTLRACDQDMITIEVQDDGPGIPDVDKATVFEPFRRGTRGATDRTGFGLGLSIVQNVARSHDGALSLHDRPGGGLICRLRLPCRASGGTGTGAATARVEVAAARFSP